MIVLNITGDFKDSRCDYHVEEVADLGSFGQVPHVNVAIMASRQYDAAVKWVSLHNKHLIIVTLEESTEIQKLCWSVCQRYYSCIILFF